MLAIFRTWAFDITRQWKLQFSKYVARLKML